LSFHPNFTDTYKLKGLRKKLIEDIASRGQFDHRVLDAMEAIPRHFFVDSAFAEQAYEDKAFPIGEGQTISQPFTVAYQSNIMEIKEGMKVLEIGTGSGYQAAILAQLGAKVYSIERIEKLSNLAKQVLKHFKLHIRLYVGDGTLGLSAQAPFDRILITAAAPDIPENLLQQLKPGGKMIVPVGDRNVQQMIRITRTETGTYKKELFDSFRFVPLIGAEGW
jgi:protein-L-isoaspartate(D-aspartate) O-methyltransferase